MKTRWYKNAVIYQIYPRSFCDSNGDGIGDLQGIISKLDYLANLGINAVWLSPCYKSPNDDNGYDISDYCDIMSEFGTLDDWKAMLDGMHARGIKLIMDLVVNHSSDEHFWFKESRKSLDNPYRDYYIWRPGKKNGKRPPNNWQSNFLGSAWQKDDLTGEYYLHLFSKKQPDLNWDNPKVREEVANICNYWFDLGVDGFRCDVIPFISKEEGLPNGRPSVALTGREHYVIGKHWNEYIRELNEKSWSRYDSLIVGECALVPYDGIIAMSDENSNLLDTSFAFEAINSDLIRKFSLPRVKKIFAKYQNIPKQCWTSNFLENHDQVRCIPRLAKGGAFRQRSASMLGTMIFFHRGTPYIYQGQEIGMTNCDFTPEDYRDIMSINVLKTAKKFGKPIYNLACKIWRKKARDNARTPMQWDSSPNAGFTTGEPWMCVNPNFTDINVERDIVSDFSIHDYYKRLIATKAKVADIVAKGDYHDYCIKSKKIYQYSHTFGDKMVLVSLNFTDKDVSLKSGVIDYSTCELLISNYADVAPNTPPTTLRPYQAVVNLLTLKSHE